MELRGLRYFVTLARELNFGKAAKLMHITQPGLSQGIKTFERQLGFPVFERNRQHVTLTAAGKALLPAAQRLLEHANEVSQLANDLAQKEQGALVISHTQSAGVGLPYTIMSSFRAAHPKLEVRVLNGFSSINIDRVASRQIDLGFVRPPLEITDDLTSVVIGHDSVVLAVPTGHRLADAPSVITADFIDEPLVYFAPEAGGLWHSIMNAVYGPGHRPEIVRIEPDEAHMLAAVAEGAGLTLITESAADMLNVFGVVLKRFHDPTKVPIGIVWRRDNLNPALGKFLKFAQFFLSKENTA
ncbi:LysR family transcriptional regulator [Kutzneria sp. CA-103260]|uniref:LysR family transcriptional regulator n=1 Tax=Kutzneria sp. CA-103260 TaxID=2802641 RepID=UPI001BA87E16|nr:LysR family transcriptional regulator [Kutzneria sp. CA-103260]QUQ68820.1 LysR family transcriptional regulator [Kutzneria sp. CA-103260]